jgi:outer membrane protein TolC
MTRFPAFAASALLLLVPAVAGAEETLTLDRAVRETLLHNASLRAGRAAEAAEAAQVTVARSAWFPRVSVAESWQRGDQPVFVFSSLLSARRFTSDRFAIDALNHPDATGFFRASIGVEQVLFDGGRTRSAVQGARIRREIAALAVDEAASGLALAATQTFGRVLASDAQRRASEAARDAAGEDLARAERRRDLGLATDADVLALAAHTAELDERVIRAQGDAAVARAELNRLMGAPVGRTYDIAAPADPGGAPAPEAPLEVLLEEAERSRPELQRAMASARLAETARHGARSALVPQVAAQAAADFSGLRFGDRASAWMVGGEVRWSLSLGGAEIAQVAAAAQSRARARAEADDVRAAVQVDVVTALRRLEEARARQAAGQAAVAQARESHRIIRDRFDAGMAGVTDVLRASSAVVDAEARQATALVDAMVSGAMLRRALGRAPLDADPGDME